MKRYLRIFLLHLERLFEHRSRSLVWFLIPLVNSGLLLFFWKGASNSSPAPGWDFSSIAAYYLMLIIASSMVMSHIEEDVGQRDIKGGGLVKYITKPFSYYWIKFSEEIPSRILQGLYGIIILFLALFFFRSSVSINFSLDTFLLAILITLMAYFMSFTFKMIVGLLAFWVLDLGGIFNLIDVIILIFAGFIAPLALLPEIIEKISNILPFAYMIYYPIISFQGKVSFLSSLNIILMQLSWLAVLVCLYFILWRKGIQKFTGVGQ